MELLLLLGTTFITLALVFYTAGVWLEKMQGLNRTHLILFYLGLVCDTIGTEFMSILAGGELSFNLHMVTGALALALMFVHAVWATIVLWSGNEERKRTFHRYSILVWAFWLVPYVSGVIGGMTGGMSS